MKKILIINSKPIFEDKGNLYIYKETGKFLIELNRYEDIKVLLFQLKMPAENNDFLADFDISDEKFCFFLTKRRKFKILSYFLAVFKGLRAIYEADFYYQFYPTNKFYEAFAILSFLFGKKIGLYVRGEQNITTPISKYLYKKAKVILTISPKFTKMINNFGGNAYTIKPMMELDYEDIVYNRSYDNKTIYQLLFVGRIEKAKGVFEIVEAVKILNRKGFFNFKVNMIGDGEDLDELMTLVSEYKIADYIEFHGSITDFSKLSSFYKNNDLFIFPSHNEGFPRVIYEAMILGLPIITSFVGSISSLLTDGYDCVEVKTHNAEDIASKISPFLEHYASKALIAKNATITIFNYLKDKRESHAKQLYKLITK